MTKYSEKLKDPRWQKKRLEIFERDGWQCKVCGAGLNDGITLNIHHTYYNFKLNPWEYPEKSLLTLCEDCHYGEQEVAREEKNSLIEALCMFGATSTELNMISCDIYNSLTYGGTIDGLIDSIIGYREKVKSANKQ